MTPAQRRLVPKWWLTPGHLSMPPPGWDHGSVAHVTQTQTHTRMCVVFTLLYGLWSHGNGWIQTCDGSWVLLLATHCVVFRVAVVCKLLFTQTLLQLQNDVELK